MIMREVSRAVQSRTGRVVLALGLGIAGIAATSQPVSAAESPAGLVVPAGLVQHRIAGKVLVGATADGKLVVYDLTDPSTPQKRMEKQLPGQILDVRLGDGVVFAVVGRHEVQAFVLGGAGSLEDYRPVIEVALARTGTETAAAEKTAKAVVGRVATVREGRLLIDLDGAGTVRPGDRLLVRSQQREIRLNLFTNREEEVVSNAPVAVIEVRQVQGNRALADLGRGEQANTGDSVEPTQRLANPTPVLAERVGHDAWIRGTVRPMFNFGEVNVASLTDLAGGWYYGPLHLQARLSPLGLSAPQAVNLANFHVLAGYQNDVAEFAVGGGYFFNRFQARYEGQCDDGGIVALKSDEATAGASAEEPPRYMCRQAGPSVVQQLRLGSVDGVNLRLTNSLAIDDGKFRFGYLEGSFDFPVARSINLYAAGGGSAGAQFGEIGTRTYFRGVGGRDTLILTTGIGGSAMRTNALFGGTVQSYDNGAGGKTSYMIDEEKSVGGLHIAVGLELRL
jgi:hypothetical protein